MPTFRYKTRHKNEPKVSEGIIEAPNQQEAIKKLRAKDVMILSVKADTSLHVSLPIFNRISGRDRILFTRELAVMVKAGLPIVQALKAIEDQTSNKALKRTITGLTNDIEGGTALSEAFGHYPQVFTPIFISVTKSGEKSGKLDNVLERLANQLEKDDDLLAKIKGAMIYPAFVLVALIGVIILILVFIIPQLSSLFKEVDMELPLVTRVLLTLSDFTQRYILLIVSVIVAFFIGLKIAARRAEVRSFLERLRFPLPVFGKLYRQVLMVRFTHTLATLLAAGLPMIEALETTSDVMNSPLYHTALKKVTTDIKNGASLSNTLLADKRFPAMIGHMVAIGESSGNIDVVLETVGSFFDKDVENMVRNLSALLEPFLMILMGLGVGLVVASVITPMYNLVNAV